jgi:3-methyladenine DNA glycosylase AlkD
MAKRKAAARTERTAPEDPQREVARLHKLLSSEGDAARAVGAKRYLKSQLIFLGATVPMVRSAAKDYMRTHPALNRQSVLALADALFSTDVHELRSLGISMLELKRSLLTAADGVALIALIRRADTWAHVDWLATKVMGPLLVDSAQGRKQLERWVQDPSFWVRRTALLCWHDALLAGAGDFEHFAKLTRPLLHEREFFIRKAIGWVLRSTARRTPERTIAFVREHASELSALSFKEATRNLPAAQIEKLSALRRRAIADDA